jgi:hypothetical protein
MKYQFLVLVFVSLLFSCETEVKKEKIDPVDWSARTAEMNDSDSLEYGKSYLSIYSQIYSVSALKTQNLAAMVSLRNTSDTESIFILSTKYYDTRGELVKSYFDNPIYLNPLETVEILINEVDISGGTGSNFIFEWRSPQNVSEPLFEAIMTSTKGQQGISFTTQSVRIQ